MVSRVLAGSATPRKHRKSFPAVPELGARDVGPAFLNPRTDTTIDGRRAAPVSRPVGVSQPKNRHQHPCFGSCSDEGARTEARMADK